MVRGVLRAKRLDLPFAHLFDPGEILELFRRDEGVSLPRVTRPSGPSDSMDIEEGVMRDIDVNHAVDLSYVNPPAGHVRRHQDIRVPLPECAHRVVSLVLAEVAVKRNDAPELPFELPGESPSAIFRPAEDHGAVWLQPSKKFGQKRVLLLLIHDRVALFERLPGRVVCVDEDPLGVAHVFSRQLDDWLRHRGGEEAELPVLRHAIQDEFDVVDEAHVEHRVGLVYDDELRGVEQKGPALDVVDDPSGGPDDDVHSTLKRLELDVD